MFSIISFVIYWRDRQLVDSSSEVEPRFAAFYLFLGFLSCVAWLFVIAEELVNLVATLGIVFTVAPELLGNQTQKPKKEFFKSVRFFFLS